MKKELIRSYLQILVSIGLLVTISESTHAQWKAESYVPRAIPVSDLASQNVDNQIVFYFPQKEDSSAICANSPIEVDNTLVEILELFQWPADNLRGLRHRFNASIRLKSERAHLSINAYERNAKRGLMILHDKNRGWIYKELSFSREGYQVPYSSFIDSWEIFQDPTSYDYYDLDEIIVFVEPKNKQVSSELIFGNLILEEFISHDVGRNHPWIDEMVTGVLYTDELLNDYSNWSLDKLSDRKLNEFPTFDAFGSENGYLANLIGLECEQKNCNEREMLKVLIDATLTYYPFYEQKKLDYQNVRKQFLTLFEDESIGYEELVDIVKDKLKRDLNDPHFDLTLPNSEKNKASNMSRSPVRLQQIGDNIIVAAVFNDDVAQNLPIGSRVHSLDGQLVTANSDYISYLYGSSKSSLKIGYAIPDHSKKIEELVVPYGGKQNITPNFIPKHGLFSVNKDSVAYLRFNNWLGDCTQILLNHREEILASKGLILDLRGNGGGYADDVLRSLSLFFSKRQIIGEMGHYWFKESIVIEPNHKELAFPDSMNVFVLVDNTTSCGSEIFLVGLKYRENSFIVGNSRTKGATATPILFRLPSGITLKAHTKFREFIFDDSIYQEGLGIEPDIWVSRTHARDFFPYEDKVLRLTEKLVKDY